MAARVQTGIAALEIVMRAVALLVPLALAGCGEPAGDAAPPANGVRQIETGPAQANSQSPPAPAATEPPAPVPSPADTQPDAESGEAAVVRDYYARIARGDYRGAWALWEDAGGASGMSADAFAASFGKYAEYRATVGAPGRVDAGAGQRYVTIPVEIAGTLRDGGAPIAMAGELILHKTADIPGATLEQRSWRIRESGVRPRP